MAARILVVDDEPSIVKLVTTTLSARGYEIITGYNGEEAVDKATLHHPDLIILDIMMPKMDGKEARQKLLSNPKTEDIPVIHLSAVGEFDSQLDAMQHGITDYITKPFSPKELAEHVEMILDPKRRDELLKMQHQKTGKLSTIVNIMHRDR
jgi:two-component system, OmpR family, alkaline phosphatase synthesis response regulator PhoP